MAITLLQSAFKAAGAVTSSTLVFPSPVTAGSLLIAYVSGGGSGTTLGASDNVNGAYHQDVILFNSGAGVTAGIHSFTNAASGTTTVTFTQNLSAQLRVLIQEWSGIVTSSALDQTASNGNTATSTFSTGTTASTAQTNELALALAAEGTGRTTTANSPYTLDASSQNKLFASYAVISSVGTQSTTFTLTGGTDNGPSMIATYKGTGGVGGPALQNVNGSLAMMGMGT